MATSVSGPLRLVTDAPASFVQVLVRAPKPRPHAGGMLVDFTTPASVEDGVVSFPCVPGPAVLVVVNARVPQVTVPLVVPDKAEASLEECIRAAVLADTAKELESKADKTYVDQRVPIDSFAGTGSPEGKVAAPAGSTYVDTAATNGAIRWVKISGAGSTGWRVEYGDTGWRNVSGQLEPGVTGNIFVARVGQTVHMMLHNVSTANAGHISLVSLPTGFRPFNISGANWRNTALTTDNGDTVRVTSYHNGFMRVLNMPTGKVFGGSISMVAESAWPTTLPGIPA